MHRHAAHIYAAVTECQAKPDFHLPLEVKDSVENLMEIMEFSPEKGTNAHTSKGLHTVHGALSSKAHPSQVNTAALKL